MTMGQDLTRMTANELHSIQCEDQQITSSLANGATVIVLLILILR